MSDLLHRIRTILLPGLTLAAIGLLLLGLADLWELNAWSLAYVSVSLGSPSAEAEIPTPPAQHSRAMVWLAQIALTADDPVAALELVNLQASQGDRLSMRLAGQASLAQGDFHGAVAIWQRAGDVESLLAAAGQAREALDLDDALMAYQAVWALKPESGTLPLANFLLDRIQDYSETEYVLRQSLDDFPASRYWPTWSRRLGDALQALECWDEAVTAYEQGIARKSDDWAANIGLGWARYKRGDGVEAALDEFQQAIAIDEDRGNGYYAAGQVLASEGRYVEADAWFAQALARVPEAKWWYMARAVTARQAGDLRLALNVYQEATSRFPDFVNAHFEMGKTYEEIGDLDKAMDAYCITLALDPEHAGAARGVTRLEGIR
jgi:tetratricopeptide (TPR) repeat protein